MIDVNKILFVLDGSIPDCEGDDCPDVTSEGLGGIFLNVHPTFKCQKGINQKMRDPQSCSRFIQCMDGLAYHFACQVSLLVF